MLRYLRRQQLATSRKNGISSPMESDLLLSSTKARDLHALKERTRPGYNSTEQSNERLSWQLQRRGSALSALSNGRVGEGSESKRLPRTGHELKWYL